MSSSTRLTKLEQGPIARYAVLQRFTCEDSQQTASWPHHDQTHASALCAVYSCNSKHVCGRPQSRLVWFYSCKAGTKLLMTVLDRLGYRVQLPLSLQCCQMCIRLHIMLLHDCALLTLQARLLVCCALPAGSFRQKAHCSSGGSALSNCFCWLICYASCSCMKFPAGFVMACIECYNSCHTEICEDNMQNPVLANTQDTR